MEKEEAIAVEGVVTEVLLGGHICLVPGVVICMIMRIYGISSISEID